jgi:hypothetical protein
MKYLKMLGLAAVAAMALMAFVGAGTASATVLCKTQLTTGCAASGWDYPAGTTIDATLKSPTSTATLETTGGTTLDTCTGSTVHGKTETTGSSTTTVSGKLTSELNAEGDPKGLTWSGCTVPTTTLAAGSLEIHWISGTDNGTLTASGAEVTVNTGFFGACVYGTGTGKDLGTLLGGSPATLAISTNVTLTKNESGLCPSETKWTATYEVTTPKPLFVTTG